MGLMEKGAAEQSVMQLAEPMIDIQDFILPRAHGPMREIVEMRIEEKMKQQEGDEKKP
jgi:hypothetical protein